MSLQERYATMEAKELVKIITICKDQYTQEAVRAAEAELRSRGETNETFAPILKEVQEDKRVLDEQLKTVEEKPLSGTQRVLFTIFPVIAFYYLIFTPLNWKKRKLEAKLYFYEGSFWYLGIWSLILAVIVILTQKYSLDLYVFLSLEMMLFLFLIFAHRRAKRKLEEMQTESYQAPQLR